MIKPFIIAAISTDGFIGPMHHTSSLTWTSGADKKFFSERTKQAGVCVMGHTTFETIGKALPDRKTIVYSDTPIDVPDITTTAATPQDLCAQLEKEGYEEVAVCGGSSIYTQFMQAQLVQKIYLTVEPIIFGNGTPLFTEEFMTHLNLESTTPLDGNSLLLEYSVITP